MGIVAYREFLQALELSIRRLQRLLSTQVLLLGSRQVSQMVCLRLVGPQASDQVFPCSWPQVSSVLRR